MAKSLPSVFSSVQLVVLLLICGCALAASAAYQNTKCPADCGLDSVRVTCPADYVYDCKTNLCFKLYMEEKSRADACAFCHSLGRRTRLLVLDTAEKRKLIVPAYVPPTPSRGQVCVWLGGLQEENEGQFFWETGNEITELWALEEPNQYQGLPEDCVDTCSHLGWLLNDEMCNNENPFICEYVMN